MTTAKSVQSTTDAVAAQLAKFSAVSLHYTDEASNIALIKQKNPNTKVFAYINPVFCYKSTDPNSEYQLVVKNHPEWFLVPSPQLIVNAKRIRSSNTTGLNRSWI